MGFLLDTHTFLWWLDGSKHLGSQASDAISDRSNDVFLSLASVWELSIKISLRKLKLRKPLADIVEGCGDQGIRLLSIKPEHCFEVGRLGFHHRDPFDRLLVAQAICEGLTFLTRDEALKAYDVNILW